MNDSIYAHLAEYDPVMKKLISLYGKLTLPKEDNLFKSLAKIIVTQQISAKAGQTILSRLEELLENKFQPDKILLVKDQNYREIGLSYSKINYLKNIAYLIKSGSLDLNKIQELKEEDIKATILKLKGFGEWSADIFLLFGLNKENILVYSDLGIKKSIQKLYNLPVLPDKEKILKISKDKSWEPYKSYVCLYLWKSLNNTY